MAVNYQLSLYSTERLEASINEKSSENHSRLHL